MSNLPNEIIFEIVSKYDAKKKEDRSCLATLRLVSKAANFVATPLLLEDLVLKLGGCRETSNRRLADATRNLVVARRLSALSLSADDIVISRFRDDNTPSETLWAILPQISEKIVLECTTLISASDSGLTRLEFRMDSKHMLPQSIAGMPATPPFDGDTGATLSEPKYDRAKRMKKIQSKKQARLRHKAQMVCYWFCIVVGSIIRSSFVEKTVKHISFYAKEETLANFLLIRGHAVHEFRASIVDMDSIGEMMAPETFKSREEAMPYSPKVYSHIRSLSVRIANGEGETKLVGWNPDIGKFVGSRLLNRLELLELAIENMDNSEDEVKLPTRYNPLSMEMNALRPLKILKLSCGVIPHVRQLCDLVGRLPETLVELQLSYCMLVRGRWSSLFKHLLDPLLPHLTSLRLKENGYYSRIPESQEELSSQGGSLKRLRCRRPFFPSYSRDFKYFHSMREESIDRSERALELGSS